MGTSIKTRYYKCIKKVSNYQSSNQSSSSLLPVAPSGAKATNKHPPIVMVLGQSLQFSPRVTISPHVCLQVTAPWVSWSAPFFCPEGSRWGFALDVRWGLLNGVADPLQVFLKDVNSYRLLSRSFPQILVANDWPVYLGNCSQAGVNESLDFFHSGSGGSPHFGSLEQHRLHIGVEDPDFSAGAEEWLSPDILQLLESCSCFADASSYISFCSPSVIYDAP